MKKLILALPLIIVGLILYLLWLPYDENGFDHAGMRKDSALKPILSLTDYTPFEWTELHVYTSYWVNEQVARDVGSRRPLPNWTFPQGTSEGSCMLIFKDEDRIVSVVPLFGRQLSLELLPRRIAKPPVKLKRTYENQGWRHLQEVSPPAVSMLFHLPKEDIPKFEMQRTSSRPNRVAGSD
jgi:hypothetical protein